MTVSLTNNFLICRARSKAVYLDRVHDFLWILFSVIYVFLYRSDALEAEDYEPLERIVFIISGIGKRYLTVPR